MTPSTCVAFAKFLPIQIKVIQRIFVSNFKFWGHFLALLFSTRTLIFATRAFVLLKCNYQLTNRSFIVLNDSLQLAAHTFQLETRSFIFLNTNLQLVCYQITTKSNETKN